MRKTLRGLAVATALSLAPATAVVAAPAQASAPAVASTSVVADAPAATTEKAQARRTISVRDTPGRQARLRIVVKPNYGNKPIIIQTRKGGKFRTTGKIRTNARGVAFKIFPGSRGGIRYRLIAKGGRDYSTAAVSFTITKRFF